MKMKRFSSMNLAAVSLLLFREDDDVDDDIRGRGQ